MTTQNEKYSDEYEIGNFDLLEDLPIWWYGFVGLAFATLAFIVVVYIQLVLKIAAVTGALFLFGWLVKKMVLGYMRNY